MVLNWLNKQHDKLEAKFHQAVDRTFENARDTGTSFSEAFVPREVLPPEQQVPRLRESRKKTGASRHTRAAHLTDDQLLEKGETAAEKLRLSLGRTTGSASVAVGAVKLLQPDHAITQTFGTAVNVGSNSTQFVREMVYSDEIKRRDLRDTRKRKPGVFRRGVKEGALGQLKSEQRGIILDSGLEETSKLADTYGLTSNSHLTSVPAYNTPPMNTPVYTTSYTSFPSGIPTTPVYMDTYSSLPTSSSNQSNFSPQYSTPRTTLTSFPTVVAHDEDAGYELDFGDGFSYDSDYEFDYD